MKEVVNDLVGYDNLKIIQNNEYFNFSLESVLVPRFCHLRSNMKIMDFCTGNAPIPLILSTITNSKIIGVELQKEIYDLAVKSVKLNNLEDQITILNKDVKEIINYYETDSFDLITCNPPYFKYSLDSNVNNNDVKSIARHEIAINIDDIINVSKKLLKNNGSLVLVHRTDRLIEIINKMSENNMQIKRIRLIYPKENQESNLVLIEATKNGKIGLKILPPLICHNSDGSYTKEILEIKLNY